MKVRVRETTIREAFKIPKGIFEPSTTPDWVFELQHAGRLSWEAHRGMYEYDNGSFVTETCYPTYWLVFNPNTEEVKVVSNTGFQLLYEEIKE